GRARGGGGGRCEPLQGRARSSRRLRQNSVSVSIAAANGPALPDISEGNVMKILRRKFLRLAAGAAALPAVSRIARAQSYPSRPVRFVVGFAPGGGGDLA